jgi:flagellar hook-associated protein 1 FlgK
MYGINIGFEIGKRALLAQQYSLNLTGHNIANVNTPGFTRQQAILSSSQPFNTANGNYGTGVDVVDVRHLRSIFLDEQYRQETQNLGKWQALSGSWNQIETIYMEPSDTGFSNVLDNFWNSWSDLAASPDDQAARVAVREQATLLTNAFHHFSSQLSDYQKSLDDDIGKRISQINQIGKQIAQLNQSIASTELNGNMANDLRDARDLLVDQLSQYVNVQVIEQPTGAASVLIGSMQFVDGNSVYELETTVEGSGANVLHKVQFKDSKIEPDIRSGELTGLLDIRDNIVPDRVKELDEMAVALVKNLNAIHQQGTGLDGEIGRNFFDSTVTGAADINIDDSILEDVSHIATSRNGEVGDNSIALQIAALRSNLVMSGGTATFGDYYNAIVGIVGIRAKEASNTAQNQQTLVNHIDENRQSLEGVSLDEEMTNMLKFQHAYEAAARVITTMDEALNTVINNMGLVGR